MYVFQIHICTFRDLWINVVTSYSYPWQQIVSILLCKVYFSFEGSARGQRINKPFSSFVIADGWYLLTGWLLSLNVDVCRQYEQTVELGQVLCFVCGSLQNHQHCYLDQTKISLCICSSFIPRKNCGYAFWSFFRKVSLLFCFFFAGRRDLFLIYGTE